MTEIENIRKIIESTAKKLNDECERLFPPDGLFYVPELVFTFECAKALVAQRAFGEDFKKCIREIRYGGNGITDLVIECKEKNFVFEFKLDDKNDYYLEDIRKLKGPFHNEVFEGIENVKLGVFCKFFIKGGKDNEQWFERYVKEPAEREGIKLDYWLSDPVETTSPAYHKKGFYIISIWNIKKEEWSTTVEEDELNP